MIAEFLYKNPRILVLTIATIVVAGLSSLFVMPRLEDPVLGKRVAVISTVYPGADVNQVEALLTIPLEEELTSIAGIKQVRSTSRTGMSNIVIELKDEVSDVDPVWSLIRNRLVDAGEKLPSSSQKPVLEVFPLKAFASIIAVKWAGDREPNFTILRRLAKRLRSDILEIVGTESVQTFGDSGEELVVKIDPGTLASLGLTTASIAQQVSESKSSRPSGRLKSAEAEVLLDIERDALPVKRLAETLISYGPRGDSVGLSEIADIKRQRMSPQTDLAIVDGSPAIVLGAFVGDDQQVDRWSVQLENTIDEFESEYPNEAGVDVLFSQREHVDQRMLTLLKNLGAGTAAVVLVVLLLMGWRSMLVVSIALPLSALMVVTGMRMLSIPIHQMSVTGLIVALGLLIDNAIVIVEEVRSRIVDGQSPQQSINASVRHLAMPLFGSTLTTALAFLPIAILPGPSGEFVGTIAISVILAISASFLLAMTVIPALNGLLRIDPDGRGLFSYGLTFAPIQELYEKSLRFVFRYPLIGVLLGLILPAIGFLVAGNIPRQFFPPSDRQQIQIEIERPARDSIAGTQATVDNVRQIVAADVRIEKQYWFLGASAPTFYYNVVPRRRGTTFYAQAFVELRDGEAIGDVVRELQGRIDEQVLDSRVIVRMLEQGPPFDAPIEIRLLGPDLATLGRLGGELRLLLSQIPNVIHTRSDLEETIPKLSLELNRVAVQNAGLTESQISGQLYTSLEGAPAGKIYDGSEEIPILVKMNFDATRSKLDLLGALQLSTATRGSRDAMGGPSGARQGPPSNPTLASLAEFKLDSDVGSIVRIKGRRVNEVMAYIEAGVLPSVVMEKFKSKLAASEFTLPTGYNLEFGGETEQRSNAINGLIAKAVVLFALVLLTLVASFRSFSCAFVIAAVGGLSVGLGPLTLATFGFPFGFMAIVGTMGLVGVAINDSIVVLAAIRANESATAGDVLELVEVVSGCTRHIIATTLTTIVGFTPLILAGGGFWPPLAITIAAGVGGATLLALYFVPSLHLLIVEKKSERGDSF